MSRKRLVICSHCEKRNWFMCGECGCPLIAKSRLDDEECPHPDGDKWNLGLPRVKWIHRVILK